MLVVPGAKSRRWIQEVARHMCKSFLTLESRLESMDERLGSSFYTIDKVFSNRVLVDGGVHIMSRRHVFASRSLL